MRKSVNIRIMGNETYVNEFVKVLKTLNIGTVSAPYKNRGSDDIRVYVQVYAGELPGVNEINEHNDSIY